MGGYPLPPEKFFRLAFAASALRLGTPPQFFYGSSSAMGTSYTNEA